MPPSRALRTTALSLAAVFFTNGALFGSWVPRIPAVRDRLELDVTTLGIVLFATGFGGLVGAGVAGGVVDRLGSRRSTVGAGALLAAGLPLVAIAPTPLTVGIVLFALGLLDAVTDIGMNAQAVQVEGRRGRSIMNALHAAWSLGTVAGGASGALAAAARLDLGVHLLAVGAVQLGLILVAAPRLLPTDDPRAGATRGAALSAPALLLGAAALAVGVLEGAPSDWSAVYLADELDASPGLAGLGFVGFSSAMLLGRVGADRVVDTLGRRRTVLVSLVIVAAGMATTLAAPWHWLAVAGFTLAGLGSAALFPLLYGAAGTLPTVTPGAGLAVMSLGARLGFLVGPPLIGLAAGALGLRVGIGLVVAAALALAALPPARS